MNAVVAAFRGQPRGTSYERWREQIWRNFCQVDVGPAQGAYIDCVINIRQIGPIIIGAARGSSCCFSRAGRALLDGADDFILIWALSGNVDVTCGAGAFCLSSQQMCLTSMSTPGTISIAGDGEVRTVRIYGPDLLLLCPKADRRLSAPITCGSALTSLLQQYLALAPQLASRLDSIGQQKVAQHVINLISLAIRESEIAPPRGRSAARLGLIKKMALARLSCSDLWIGDVASPLGISARHAQRLFEQAGMTFTEFLLEERLLSVRKRLLDTGCRPQKISDIAFAAGFADLSYFNRAFKVRFGMTPKEMRNYGLARARPDNPTRADGKA
jgi:AraC-like DNA-binding protein